MGAVIGKVAAQAPSETCQAFVDTSIVVLRVFGIGDQYNHLANDRNPIGTTSYLGMVYTGLSYQRKIS